MAKKILGTTKRASAREHWTKWIKRDLIGIGYWPQWQPWQTEWAQTLDTDEIVKQMVEGEIDVLDWGVPENYAHLDDGFAERHPALREFGRDPLAELVEKCHAAGKKVLAGVQINSVISYRTYYRQHTEELEAQGADLEGLDAEPPRGSSLMLCMNTATFRQGFFRYLAHLSEAYDIDGYVFDGPWPHITYPWDENGKIICELCRQAHLEETGEDFPQREDWNDPAWKRYVRWWQRNVTNFLIEMQQAIDRADPRLFTCINHCILPGYNWTDRADLDTFHLAIDSAFSEYALEGHALHYNTTKANLNRAGTDGRTPMVYHKTANLQRAHLAYGRPPTEEVAALAYIGLALGGRVHFHSSMDDLGQPHAERSKVYQSVGREIAKKREWLADAEFAVHAAIHYGANSRDYYGGSCASDYLSAVIGMDQALAESHITTAFVLDHQLTKEWLKPYRLLVLSNSACLSEAQCDVVREFVQAGGDLIAAGETSLYDEEERMRKDFALADVLGVHLAGQSQRTEQVLKEPMRKRWPFLLKESEPVAGLPEIQSTESPWFDIQVADDRQVLATWAELRPDTIMGCVNMGVEIIGDSESPALVYGRYGRGKVIYSPADLGGTFFVDNCTETREMLAQLAVFLAPPEVMVSAPKSVLVSTTRQKSKGRTIIHLVNFMVLQKTHGHLGLHTGPTDPGRHSPRPDGIPDDLADLIQHWRQRRLPPYNPVDEIIPVRNIEVKIKQSRKKIKRIYLAPERKALKSKLMDGYRVVRVPQVSVHAMVVVEK